MFKPKYTIDSDMINAISEISEIKAIIDRSRVLPLNEAQLRRQAIVRMAHTSTSIEGNKLAEYQVDKVLSGMSVNADERSIKEVKNYQEAIKKMEEMTKEKKSLTLEKILELHSVLIKGLVEAEKSGHFRPAEIYLVDDFGDGREHLRFKGPDAKKVPFLVNELLKWLYSEEGKNLHPILKAGIFHSHFVNIHPFVDGNGRMARLLTTYLLYIDGWDFKRIIVLEDFYNRNRQQYYDALAATSGPHFVDNVDYTPWLEYFLAGFLVEARKVSAAIKTIGFNQVSEGKQIFLDKDEIKIMDFLTTTSKVTSDDVMNVLGIAKRTAQLKLKNLVDKNLIKSEGKARATFYTLSD